MPKKAPLNWYRGQLHAHSNWSDGRHFAEYAVTAYRDRGYRFLCLSEHNRFATDPDDWREVYEEEGAWPPKITYSSLEECIARFGRQNVDVRTTAEGKTEVRLKTWAEVNAMFDEPGRFLLLPGVEMTQAVDRPEGQLHLHANVINVNRVPESVNSPDRTMVVKVGSGLSMAAVVAMSCDEAARTAARCGSDSIFFVNHPVWRFCDVKPEDIIDCQRLQFLEICNNGARHPPPEGIGRYGMDLFWDAVNAFRLRKGLPLVYGIASDDAHFYRPDSGKTDAIGNAWVVIRATELTADSLFQSMRRGDFYSSCGIELENVQFDPVERKLRVWVNPSDGVDYAIHFITTKQDFDDAVGSLECPPVDGRPFRTIPLYSDDIGRTEKTVNGLYGEYVMKSDDLYVRARIDSSRPSLNTCYFHPKFECAWTQPYL